LNKPLVEKRKWYVYLITNIINHNGYVGKTYDIEMRFEGHKNGAKTKDKKILYSAIRKYGIANFTIKKLSTHRLESSSYKNEKRMIKKFGTYPPPNGYNMTEGGEGVSGQIFTPRHRHRISIGNIGKIRTPEHIETYKLAQKTHYSSPEGAIRKKRIGDGNRGKVRTPKMRAASSKVGKESYIGEKGDIRKAETSRRLKGKKRSAAVRKILSLGQIKAYRTPKGILRRASISKTLKETNSKKTPEERKPTQDALIAMKLGCANRSKKWLENVRYASRHRSKTWLENVRKAQRARRKREKESESGN